jgi:HEXXH motif-containing protein
MISNLEERVELALKNIGDCPWLPELTTKLVSRGWRNLFREVKLTPSKYGTGRVIVHDANAPRNIVSLLPMILSDTNTKRVIQIETLVEDLINHYKDAGVRFYTIDELIMFRYIEHLKEAVKVLKCVPTLFHTVALLVKSIHLIDAYDDNYDISFSEPQIPFSIFVSIPRHSSSNNVLRIAEAIVHEAMHLQLTLVEQIVPLVISGNKTYFSPWKGENRSPQGLLHALYVFRVIDSFLRGVMLSGTATKDHKHYIYNRRSQIAGEIEQVKLLQGCPQLTSWGDKFLQALLVR